VQGTAPAATRSICINSRARSQQPDNVSLGQVARRRPTDFPARGIQQGNRCWGPLTVQLAVLAERLDSTWRDSQPCQPGTQGSEVDGCAMRRRGGSRVRGIGKWRGGVMQREEQPRRALSKACLRNGMSRGPGRGSAEKVDWAAQPLSHKSGSRERGRKRWCAQDWATERQRNRAQRNHSALISRGGYQFATKNPPQMTPKRTRVHSLGPDGMTGPTITARAPPNTSCPEVCWQLDAPCGGLVAA